MIHKPTFKYMFMSHYATEVCKCPQRGLQFKDVFLPMCEITHEDDTRAALYVAVSRTSERLYLTYSNQLFTWFPDESSDVYANPIIKDEDNLPF